MTGAREIISERGCVKQGNGGLSNVVDATKRGKMAQREYSTSDGRLMRPKGNVSVPTRKFILHFLGRLGTRAASNR